MKVRILFGAAVISCIGAVLVPASGTVEYVDPVVAAELSTVMPRPVNSTESTYFVFTDRYANGSEDNDYGAGSFSYGFDTQSLYAFHGGDFVGLKANLDRIKRLGFTSIWITPPVANDDNGYHGYWGVDFTKVDPHLGTGAEFKSFVDAVHAKGMKVIMDIVVNHTADVIRYAGPNDGVFYNLADTPYKDADGVAFDLASKTGLASCTALGQSNCFPILDNTTYIYGDPENKSFPHQFYQTSTVDLLKPDFLKDPSNYHNRGDANDCGWAPGDCQMYGDFAGLDDLFTEKPQVVNGLIDTYAAWIRNYGIDGFRFDTAKHVNPEFWDAFVPAMNQAAADAGKNTQLTMFSEAWIDDPYSLGEWYRNNAPESVLDFAAQTTFTKFAAGYNNGSSMINLLSRDDYFNTGNKPGVIRNAYGLTTFLGNHDMGRGNAMIIKYAADTGSNLTKRVQLANALMFLSRGAPTVYYGDEVGLIGTGGDAAARQDMMKTYRDDWRTEARVGASPRGSKSLLSASNETHPLFVYIKSLQALRAKYPALKDGAAIGRVATGKTAAWSRVQLDSSKPDNRREYVVVANANTKSVTLTIPVAMKNTYYTGVFANKLKVKSSATYGLKITVPARTTYVFRANSKLPAVAAAPMATVSAVTDSLTGSPAVVAKISKTVKDPTTVTFLARPNAETPWTAIGTDDAAAGTTFKFMLDSWVWGNYSTMEFAAVTRTSDGKTVGSAVISANRADIDSTFRN